MTNHKFSYNWNLSDGYPAKGIEYHGSKVFSCFACGGGSTMGYKMAGFDVIGMNEIDPKMAACYVENHNPKYAFVEPIQDFKDRDDLPKELFDLDILDGSPPCSSFSMAGNREKDWGKKKKFREGQSKQVLDTLFFDFLDLAERLQPKIIIAENVKGILLGNAINYSKKIVKHYDKIGYKVKVFTLDASRMGVPQKRERVFFIGIRKDLAELLPQNQSTLFNDFPLLDLVFFENLIPFSNFDDLNDSTQTFETDLSIKIWSEISMGDSFANHATYNSGFTAIKVDYRKPLPTICGQIRPKSGRGLLHHKYPRVLNKKEYSLGGSFPLDYNFKNVQYGYLIGMSVPPIMTAQISNRIYVQWISYLKSIKSLNRGIGASV